MRISCMIRASREPSARATDSTQIESFAGGGRLTDAGAMTTTASLTAGADRVAAPAISFPGSPEYDRDRRAWNLTADQRPAAVCVATNVAHVRAAVAYARARGLHLAAQSTGHFAQGLPPLERTLLLKPRVGGGNRTRPPCFRAQEGCIDRRSVPSVTRWPQAPRRART
jgi:hypothetical protein